MTPEEQEFLELALTVELEGREKFNTSVWGLLRRRAQALAISRNPELAAQHVRLCAEFDVAERAYKTFAANCPKGLLTALNAKND